MVRPRRGRRIRGRFGAKLFKPAGIWGRDLDEEIIFEDEFEALRLRDYEGFDQNKACEEMDISQATFCRIYKSAREKIAKALVEGKIINFGGEIMPNKDGTGPDGKGPRTGRCKGKCGCKGGK